MGYKIIFEKEKTIQKELILNIIIFLLMNIILLKRKKLNECELDKEISKIENDWITNFRDKKWCKNKSK